MIEEAHSKRYTMLHCYSPNVNPNATYGRVKGNSQDEAHVLIVHLCPDRFVRRIEMLRNDSSILYTHWYPTVSTSTRKK